MATIFSDKKSLILHFCAVFLVCVFTAVVFGISSNQVQKVEAATRDSQNIVYMKLKDGDVVIELFPDLAPIHVKRIKELVRAGFYNGKPFHRVIDGFMAQVGEVSPSDKVDSSLTGNIKAEFSNKSHKRGILSMARASDPDSASTQFFIVFKDSPFLDQNYTIFGKVLSGLEVVDKIKKGETSRNGAVENPDKIISMAIASDVEKSKK